MDNYYPAWLRCKCAIERAIDNETSLARDKDLQEEKRVKKFNLRKLIDGMKYRRRYAMRGRKHE
jgi:hypothetical protein